MENYEKTDRMIELAFMMQYSYEGLLSTLEGWDDEMQAALGSGYSFCTI